MMSRAEPNIEILERPRWSILPTAVLSSGMIAVSGLMAVVPSVFPASGVTILAILILAAGLIDIMAAIFVAPKWARGLVLWAGIAAVGASGTLLLSEQPQFLFAAAVVTGWLVVKATTLVAGAARLPHSAAKSWLVFGALTNVVLAVLAIVIVSSLAFAILLFGPVPQLARFSLIPALSMFVTGLTGLAAGMRPRRDG